MTDPASISASIASCAGGPSDVAALVQRIQAALNAPGINKAELARRAKVAPSVVKDMSRPNWRPLTVHNLIAVEGALGLSGAPSEVAE